MVFNKSSGLLLFIIFLIEFSIVSQENQKLNLPDRDLTFLEYIDIVEKRSDYKFYFDDPNIEKIVLKKQLLKLQLKSLLEEFLTIHNFSFIMDKSNIVIYKGESIKNRLNFISTNPTTSESNKNYNINKSVINKYQKKKKDNADRVIKIGLKKDNKTHATISGYIKDFDTGEPLIGATVYIEELKNGTITDSQGFFVINLIKGTYTLTFRLMGMKLETRKIHLISDGSFNIELTKKLVALNEIVVKEDKYHNIRGMQIGLENISMKEIKELPLAVGEKDVLKASLTLPGVQTIGESSSGYNVRGGSADQNLFMINSVPVFNTSHMFGFFSTFNPDVIQDFKLYKSNIPVEYGGRISSVFDIKTKNGNNKNFSMRGGISPVTAKLTLEGPIVKDKTSYILGLRSTYSDWILKRIENPDIRNSEVFFYDIVANINSSINERNKINVFGYLSGDKFTLVSDIDYEYMNLGASISWKHIFSKRFYSNFKGIYSSYNLQVTDKQELSAANTFNHNLEYKELNSSFIFIPNQKNELKFGINSTHYLLNPGNYIPENESSVYEALNFQNESALESAVYIGDRYELTQKISIEAGLRYSIFNYLGPKTIFNYEENNPKSLSSITDTINYSNSEIIKTYSGLDIRFGFRYIINNLNSVKFAYNRINQYLLLLSNSVAISPTDRWKLCDPYIEPIVGEQFNLGYYKNIENTNLEASIEFYYKNNFSIPDFKNGADLVKNEYIEQDILAGFGRNYGFEFMIKKNHGKLTGWANYTYSKSELKFDGERIEESINNGSYYPSNHDQPHNINFVSNYKLSRRLSFSTNFTYRTGRPTTLPVSKYFINDQPVIGYSKRNGQRIPDYWRIDISINIEGNLRKRKLAHSYWMLSVYNLTGRKNAYSVFFNNENGKISGYKLSVYGSPILTLSYNFKLGNYASN